MIDRLEKWLKEHPGELFVLSYKPPRPSEASAREIVDAAEDIKEATGSAVAVFPPPGEFLVSCQFGEEQPQEYEEARKAAIMKALEGDGMPESTADDILEALEAVQFNMMAGGAVYGADPDLWTALHEAIDRRYYTNAKGGPVLEGDEARAMELLGEFMTIVNERWGLQSNHHEFTAAIHVLQGFVVQHMLTRLAPGAWGTWYATQEAGPQD